MLRIVLMGPPGAGKGTQAQKMKEQFGMTHLSSGDIFRAEKASGSSLGRELDKYMSAGELVPDDLVVEIMAKAILSAQSDKGLLLDGFPRTVAQAEALDRTLGEKGVSLDAVVVINADDELLVERITGRRVCPSTGKVYHVKYMPPKRDMVDDETGEPLIQRDDDKEEVVRQRLEKYKQQTEPVIGYYRRSGSVNVIDINGNRKPDEVAEEITQALQALRR
jgi:adenylate kinase